MKYGLVIFDFDGTLGDTRESIVRTFQASMKELDLPVASDEECAATIGLTLEGGYRALFPDFSDAQIDLCAATYRRIFSERMKNYLPPLFPGVKETLEALKTSGHVLTIASSRHSEGTKGFLKKYGIFNLFSLVLGAAEVEKPKPDPDAVLKTMNMLHFAPADTLVVGDMPFDIQMGSRAGAATCGVTWGNSNRHDLTAAGADYVIDTFPEILKIA
jgi:phosphoglycolate phosphatase